MLQQLRHRWSRWTTPILAVSGLLAPLALAQPADLSNSPAPSGMMQGIFDKLQYDRQYFESVLELKAKGRTDARLSKDDFDKEVKRASANAAVLRVLFDEKEAYDKRGKHLSLPPRAESHRVYSNLITLLNMLKSFDAKDWKGVLAAGERVVISNKEDLGLVRNEDARYYLALYREYFWLMAAGHYRQGNDKEAVTWLARVDSDVNVQDLKKQLAGGEGAGRSTVHERLAKLYSLSIGLVPPAPLNPSPDTDWMGAGFAEVFTSDLVSHTNLTIIERANVDKVLKEIGLSQSGITDEKNAQKVGELLTAGSLIRGSYRVAGDQVELTLEISDGADGKVLASKSGVAKKSALFAEGRDLLLALLQDAGWLSEDNAHELKAVRAPNADTIRDLLNARLMMGSKSEQAKELYKKAMKESSEYAKAFEELRKSFEGVNPTVAVMSFVNVSGANDDTWMSHGATEALHSDLPQIGFTLSERAQLTALLYEQSIGQVFDTAGAAQTAQKVGADFVLLGSVLHRTPTVRIDARFVDVGTGLVLQTFDVSGRDEEYPILLSRLSQEISRRFNIKLSAEQLKQLTGAKMNREEFERFARQALQQEQLARQKVKEKVQEEKQEKADAERRSNTPFWAAAGGAVGGAAIATTGLLLASRSRDEGAYASGLLVAATRPEDVDRLTKSRDGAYGSASTWTVVGGAGAVVALGSVAYLAYQQLYGPGPTAQSVGVVAADSPRLVPLVGATREGAQLGVSGSF